MINGHILQLYHARSRGGGGVGGSQNVQEGEQEGEDTGRRGAGGTWWNEEKTHTHTVRPPPSTEGGAHTHACMCVYVYRGDVVASIGCYVGVVK